MEREIASTAPTLRVGCYYGGNPIGPQLKELRRGVEIVVGTPGRIIDLIDQDALDLSAVSLRVPVTRQLLYGSRHGWAARCHALPLMHVVSDSNCSRSINVRAGPLCGAGRGRPDAQRGL